MRNNGDGNDAPSSSAAIIPPHRSDSPNLVQHPPHPPHHFTFARRTLHQLVEDSEFFGNRKAVLSSSDCNNSAACTNATIHERDIVVGGLLGQGGFCEVRYCCAPVKNEDSAPMGRYAMKYLSPSRCATAPNNNDGTNKAAADPQNKVFQRGIADLAMEACFLSSLRHDNIISCHYVSEGSLEENFNTEAGGTRKNSFDYKNKKKFKEEIVIDAMGKLVLREVPIVESKSEEQHQQQEEEVYKHRFGYFLLLDVLHETLAHRIDRVYIPQVLLATSVTWSLLKNSDNINDDCRLALVPSSDLTNSLLLLHTHEEKRESLLKRMTSRAFFHHHHHKQQKSYSSSAPPPGSSNGVDDSQRSLQQQQHYHDYLINDQKQKLGQRLRTLLSIANALQYLHENHIIFRDIKPDNIGFYRDYSRECSCGLRPQATVSGKDVSMRGCKCYFEIPKLFDFGLAKELKIKYRVPNHLLRVNSSREYSENKEYAANHHRDRRRGGGNGGDGELRRKTFSPSSSPSSCSNISSSRRNHRISGGVGGGGDADDDNTVYKLTGCTGSRRYMAPEVCFHDPYNEKADVYSFGMMLYQVASLVTPFDGYSSYDHEKQVLRGGYRPDIALPTKKDLLMCKKIEEELFASSSSSAAAATVTVEGGGHEDDDNDEGDNARRKNNSVRLPPPSEKLNNVLAIKSKSVWTKELNSLIDECWDYDMKYRPDMKDVVVRMQSIIDELTLSPQQQLQQGGGTRGSSFEAKNDVSWGFRNNINKLGQEENGEGRKNTEKESMIIQKVDDGMTCLAKKKESLFRFSRSGSGSTAIKQ